jgi:SAM-dependent methyltransferase
MSGPGSGDDGDEVARTRAVYEEHAEGFSEKYRRDSVAERFWDEVTAELPAPAPASDAEPDAVRVLDAGCGPGADAATFTGRGYEVVGVDVTRPFLCDAAAHSPGARYVAGDARRLPLAGDSVDVAWACASLLHLATADVPDALAEFRRVLRPGGVLFASLKEGDDAGYDLNEHGRFFAWYRPDELRDLVEAAGFEVRTLLRDSPEGARSEWLRLYAEPRTDGSDAGRNE